MTAITDTPVVPEPAGAHHIDGDLTPAPATTPPAGQPDPELPEPGRQGDLETAWRIADYALAKLRRWVAGSDEISSHFIELSVRLGELYARLGEAMQRQPEPAAEEPAPEPDEPQLQFGLEEAEAAELAAAEMTDTAAPRSAASG